MKRAISIHKIYLDHARAVLVWMVCIALVVQPTLVYALPTGGTVVGGDASIVAGDSSLTVNQTTQRALINWTGFDIGGAESVQFNQPSASSITLNRVNSATASQIDGSLSANGQVWIVNQNGVMFGQGAQVNVGGLLATTANISDNNFMNGNYAFDVAGNPAASIINDGSITVADAGFAALVAPVVRNNGVIQAKLGTVNLASGDTFALDLYGDGLINLEASAALQQQIVSNSGLIQANGGSVLLTAAAAGDMVDSLINMDGIIQANSIGEKNGTVVLYAEGSNAVAGNIAADKGVKQGTSTVLVRGVLDASGRDVGERGGNITVTGDSVALLDGAIIDATGHTGLSGTTSGLLVSDHRIGSAGGDIRIGGDYLGSGDTATAKNLYVGSGVLVLNDSLFEGDAGRTIFWSDDTTKFYGNVYARALGGKPVDFDTWNATAGGDAGDGGFVETSGKKHLDAGGYVDLTASDGNRGTYFLDPTNITIYGNFAPTDVADLRMWLDASDAGTVTLTFSNDSISGTASGTMSTNTITTSADNASQFAVGAKIRMGGSNGTTALASDTSDANTYTIASISGTTITTVETLTATYNAGTAFYRGLVSSWTDKSGQTNHAAQATAGAMPLWLSNGQNNSGTILFDGTSDKMTVANHATLNPSTITLFMSAQMISDRNNWDSYLTKTTNNYWGDGYGMVTNNSGAANRSFYINDSVGNIASTATPAGFALLAGKYDQVNVEMYQDGALMASDPYAVAINNSSNDLLIGAGEPSYHSNFKTGDILLFGSAISTNSHNLIDQYQSAKWGVALTPPGTGADEVAKATASDGYSVFTTRYLERLSQSANVSLQATNDITLDFNGDTLNFATAGRSLTMNAGDQIVTASNGAITTNNGAINLTATNGVAFDHDMTLNTGGGALNITTTGGTSTIGNIATNGGQITLNVGGTTTVSGIISGTGTALSKSGSGVLNLNNANTYTGGTFHNSGTIQLGDNSAVGTGILWLYGDSILQGDGTARTLANNIRIFGGGSTNPVIISGSSDLTFNGSFGSLAQNRTLTVNNSGTTTFGAVNISQDATSRTLTIDGTGNVVIGGTIDNGSTSTASGLTKAGTGTLTLDGSNTYGGTTTLTAGTIEVGHNNALGTGTLSLNGGTLQGDGVARTLANAVTLAADSVIAGLSDLNFDGTFGNLSANRTLTVNNSGTTTFDDISISDSATDRTLTIDGTGNVTVSGVIADGSTATASGLTKAGTGTLTLNGANTYGGNSSLTAGTVVIGNNTALGSGQLLLSGATLQGDGTSRTLANNVTLDANSTIAGSSVLQFDGTFGNLSADRTLTFNNSANTIFDDINISASGTNRVLSLGGAGNVIVNGIIANGGGSSASSIAKIGSGLWTVNGNNTYGGTTYITGGTTEVGHDNALGASTVALNGGTLRGNGSLRTLANTTVVWANSTISGSSDLVFNGTFGALNGDRTLTVNNSGATTFGNINISDNASNRTLTIAGTGNTTVTGTIANGSTSTTSGITKTGSGTLTLDGNNTYGGTTTLTAGTIEVGHNNALGTGALSLNGGTLRGDGTSRTLANSVTVAADSTISGSSALQFDGTLGNVTGTRYLDVSNSATTTFGNINISANGTDRSLIFTGSGNSVVNGVVANGGGSTGSSLGLISSGSLTLNGNNTYGGSFYHDGGTLILGHDNALGTANFLAYGGTIQGTGGTRNIANNISYWDDTTFAGSVALIFNGDFYNTNNLSVTNNNTATTTFSNIDLSYDASNFTLTLGGTGNTVVSGVISNGGGGSTTSAITKIGAGTLTLDGNNTYGGTTTLTAGAIEVGHNNALGTGTLSLNGGTLQGDGTTRTLANAVTLAADSTIAGSSALQFDGTFGNLSANTNLAVNNSATTTFDDIDISNSATSRTLTINGTGNAIVNGVIADGSTATASTLIKNGSGTLTLNGNNTHGGQTTVNGAVIIGHNNAFGDSLINLGFGGSLQGDGVARTIANSISLGAAFTIGGSSDLTFNGALTNSWANNTLTINNSGLTTLNNINLSNNATDRTMTVAGTGDVIVSGTIANGSTSTTSGLTKTGSGTLTLSGNNTYAGDTTINGGTLRLGAANRLANTTDIIIGASGTFDMDGYNETVATITNGGAITMGTGNTLTTTGAQTHTGSISGTDISIIANTGNLTFDAISANTLFAQALAGDIILNDQINAAANAGTSITLVADDQFINNFGATALQTAGTARWLVYSEDSANNTRGSLAGFNRYGCTYNAGSPDCAVGTDTPATGNGFYFNVAPTITITGLTANNKEYDGNTTATLGGTATANGAINGDTITFDASGVTATFDTKDVGVGKTVTIAGYAFATNMGYLLTQPAAVLANITAKALTITGLTAANKVYNGNTSATLTGTGALSGVVGAETVGFSAGTATFDTKDVGTGKTVTASGFTLNGADAGNYTLTQPGTWLANITAAALTITGLSAANKVYDGTTTATLTGTGALSGVVGAETVGFNAGTANFDSAEVGTGKTVTGSGFSLTGADMGNYSLTQPSWFADITAASSSASGVTTSNQSAINAILAQIGLLSEANAATGTAGGVFRYADGVPEPTRMEITPVEDEVPATAADNQPASGQKPQDSIIEINAIIDLNGLLKENAADVETVADAKSAPTKELKSKPTITDNSVCNNMMGSAVCASKIFSTVGVPNI